eukprot:4993308-Ditylum_brightwellii.AAC.1
MEIPKKVFDIMPKSEGSNDHLNFGEDYKSWVNYSFNLSPTFTSALYSRGEEVPTWKCGN